MSGFEIWIRKEYLEYWHQFYSSSKQDDVLKMKERIEVQLHVEEPPSDNKDDEVLLQQGEHTSHSTTEGNVAAPQLSEPEEENELESGIMDRADVLFKYILRSFRKHYCKSF